MSTGDICFPKLKLIQNNYPPTIKVQGILNDVRGIFLLIHKDNLVRLFIYCIFRINYAWVK